MSDTIKKVKLGDVAEYINGYAFKPTDWSTEGYTIIRIQDLTGSDYQTNRFNGVIDEKYVVNNGDLLISWSATLGVFIWEKGKAYLNQHIFKVNLREGVDKAFFYYQVGSILEKAQSETHGATMKHLTRGVFDNLPFVLPTVYEQKAIAKKLDKVVDLIEKRKKQIEKLDELVKSRFIEMFGDCEDKTDKWSVVLLSELCFVGSSKRIYQSDLVRKGVPFLRVADLIKKIETNELKSELFISNSKYETFKANKLVPCGGDILVTSRGTLGKCYIVKTEDKFYFQDGMISWLSNLDKNINSVFLMWLFKTRNIDKQIENMQAGSTVAYLSISMLKKLKIIVPPIELQNKFAEFVEKVEKSKSAIKKSLSSLETLKKSLMQKYFG